jgi:1-hydroxycarotenoid 3,4-desaturase
MSRKQDGSARPIRVLVIGGGIGGLAAAIELASQGASVALFERQDRVGGKLREVVLAGRPVDAGPTVLTMRWVFDGLFEAAGRSLDSELGLDRSEMIARHAWTDGSRLDLYSDRERSAAAIAAFAGSDEADGFHRFCAHAERIYGTVESPFLLSQRPSLPQLIGRFGLGGLMRLGRIDAMRSVWTALGGFFRDPRLRQLFGRYATYYGCSPFLAPATLNLIAHAEMQGVWTVREGMYSLARALAKLAADLGVEIRCGSEVERIHLSGGRASGIGLAGGPEQPADAIVANCDVSALAGGRFGPGAARAADPVDPADRSLSAVTRAMVARVEGYPLLHHNVFFSDDYLREFEEIFVERKLPTQPTVYVCAQDRSVAGFEPDRAERVFCIVNAPASGDRGRPARGEIEACIERGMEVLSLCGVNLRAGSGEVVLADPASFERDFPGSGGALYGKATHGWLAPMRRPAARSRIPGLYLAGGSAHPGAGLPMVALGGRLAARALLEDLTSIRMSPLAATRGGTPTV